MDRTTGIEAAIARGGGYADRRALIAAVGRRGLDRALTQGTLRRLSRGLYALADSPADDARLAAQHGGVLYGLSAARHLRWPLLRDPTRVTVAVRHHRPLPPAAKRVTIVRRAFAAGDIREGICTSPLRTVLDCAVMLPHDEAVAVADSALRSGDVDRDDLLLAVARGRGARRAATARVSTLADGRAANPFESALRVRCLDAGLDVQPQVPIQVRRRTFRVDLADRGRRLVIEGDSFTHHASPEAFARDCIRYTELTTSGWTVLRMPYAAVVDDAAWCRGVLRRIVDETR